MKAVRPPGVEEPDAGADGGLQLSEPSCALLPNGVRASDWIPLWRRGEPRRCCVFPFLGEEGAGLENEVRGAACGAQMRSRERVGRRTHIERASAAPAAKPPTWAHQAVPPAPGLPALRPETT